MQAVGRLLTYADIDEGLRGHRAELFWPVDSLWYLIEIRDVDLNTQRASVMCVLKSIQYPTISWTVPMILLSLQAEDLSEKGNMTLLSSVPLSGLQNCRIYTPAKVLHWH